MQICNVTTKFNLAHAGAWWSLVLVVIRLKTSQVRTVIAYNCEHAAGCYSCYVIPYFSISGKT
jgi:hypothetical protein